MIICTASGAKSQRIDSYNFFFKFLQVKAMVQNSKVAQQENAALMAENVSLRQAILKKSCFACGGAMVPAELPAENQRPLKENGRLRGEYTQQTHHTHRSLHTHIPHSRAHTRIDVEDSH
jgi:hypothetical protein